MHKIMFTGHRNSKRVALPDTVGLRKCLRHIGYNENTFFYAGGCPGFDTEACKLLLDMGVSQNQLELFLPQKKAIVDSKDEIGSLLARAIVKEIMNRTYVSGVNFTQCCMTRNQLMVDKADICITNLTEDSGGTFRTVQMAKKKGIPIYVVNGENFEVMK